MADIFIGYAHGDRGRAQKLATALEDAGWSVWWDTRLKGGDIWDEVIERELQSARSVVVLWSKTSIKSRWVKREARYADEKRMLIPAFIEKVKPPLEFSDIQAEDLNEWDGTKEADVFRNFLSAIATFVGEPPKKGARPATKATSSGSVPLMASKKKAASKSTKRSTQLPGNIGLVDFWQFIGIRPNDKLKKVISIYGEPDHLDTSSGRASYIELEPGKYGLIFVWSLDGWGKPVHSIELNSAKAVSFIEKSVEDPKLAFLGANSAEIIRLLGEPDLRREEELTYENYIVFPEKNVDSNLFLRFRFSGKDGRCSSIVVTW